MYVFALSEILVTVFATVLYVNVSKKIINYNGFEVCHDFLINVFMASIMGLVVFTVGKLLSINYLVLMFVQILIGAILYIGLSLLFKFHNQVGSKTT